MTMKLKNLLQGMQYDVVQGALDTNVTDLACDSRRVLPGSLFVALRGYQQDGHTFIDKALQNGASAVIGEVFTEQNRTQEGKPLIQVPDTHQILPVLAARYFGHPYAKMHLTGITGTNGKTTTSYLLESILSAGGAMPGVLGTINYRTPTHIWPAATTTPGPLELMRVLRKMADEGVTHVIMEVSSHALDQGRVAGCPFRTAVFTNISRDHLDYHHSMEAYFKAKSLLFSGLTDSPEGPVTAVINLDDPLGKILMDKTSVPVLTYGLEKNCAVRAETITASREGVTAQLITPSGKIAIRSSLIGNFNIYNILAAAAVGVNMGIKPEIIASGIRTLRKIPGRLERVRNTRGLTIVVDYAHTPDALLNAITAVKNLVQNGRIITVFGCGGDRDKGKRREMGRVAGELSDLAMITSDNPRSEDPMAIIHQIEEGIIESHAVKQADAPPKPHGRCLYILETERSRAIQLAIDLADKNDLILIAGKGHEDYQIIGNDKRHFDDREVAANAAA